MQIVLIEWSIKKGAEAEFETFWKTVVPVEDRSRMIGEFLSRPTGHEKFTWITWDLRDEDATRFINVGLWADAAAFHTQIGQYFNPDAGKKEFEQRLRRRALLTPDCWRRGQWDLPDNDSNGVR